MSLVDLAQAGSLPPHEMLDTETISWIEDNTPSEFSGMQPQSLIDLLPSVKQFTPSESWFVSNERAQTIHGVRHLMRVTCYAIALMSTNSSISEEDWKVIAISASLHDLRRITDNEDAGHAMRSADWFRSNVKLVKDEYKVELSDESVEKIYNVISMHELSNEELVSNPTYLQVKQALNVLKTADALDRYIQPKLKWWINERYLSVIPDISLKYAAYKLVIASEKNRLTGMDNIQSVLNAIKDNGNEN